MKGKNDDRFSPLMCWKKNYQIDCTAKKMQNTIPNPILLVSGYCSDEYKKGVK